MANKLDLLEVQKKEPHRVKPLLVLRYVENAKGFGHIWEVRCLECKHVFQANASRILRNPNDVKKCPECRRSYQKRTYPEDSKYNLAARFKENPESFSPLKILGLAESKYAKMVNTQVWSVECQCGTRFDAQTYDLTRKNYPVRHCVPCRRKASNSIDHISFKRLYGRSNIYKEAGDMQGHKAWLTVAEALEKADGKWNDVLRYAYRYVMQRYGSAPRGEKE